MNNTFDAQANAMLTPKHTRRRERRLKKNGIGFSIAKSLTCLELDPGAVSRARQTNRKEQFIWDEFLG